MGGKTSSLVFQAKVQDMTNFLFPVILKISNSKFKNQSHPAGMRLL